MKFQIQKRILLLTSILMIIGLNLTFTFFMHQKAQESQNVLIENKISGDARSILTHLYLSGNVAWFESTLKDYEKFAFKCLGVTDIAGAKIFGSSGKCSKTIEAKNYMNETVLFLSYTLPKVSLIETVSKNSRLLGLLLTIQIILLSFFYKALSFINKRHTRALIEKESSAKIIDSNRTLSHNLKSPIAALKSLKQNISLELSADESSLLDCTIESISQISKGLSEEPGTAKIEFFVAEKAIHDVLELKKLEAKNVRLNITNEVLTSDTIIRANISEFQSVLSNVLNNSIEAAVEGKVLIHVKVTERGEHLIIEISDNGIGMSPSNLNSVFLKNVTYGKASGKGIGLFHARKAITSWGGRISASSEIGRGSVITISIPVFLNRQKSRIVLIDDQRLNQLNWLGSGKKLGIQVACFSSYNDFLEAGCEITSNTPIFVDYDLGKENGLEIARKLNKRGFKLITLASGHESKLSQEYHQISKDFPIQ